ncbi:MAG: D-alanyl-D-alanine carboxypeptidase family protein [Candidatus Gracilibacteria bacterium]
MFQSLLSFLLASSLSLGSFASDGSEASFNDKTLLSVFAIPVQQEEFVAPATMSGEAILAVDLETQATLYEKNATNRVPIASLTKLMTAALVLEENDPNAVVTVSANAASASGSRMGLRTGEEITVRNLLYGLLIESGNDAALALAEYNAGSESSFIEKMNAMADKLGLDDTHYKNADGLDNTGAYSSARDLAVLTTHLLKDESIREIVNQSKITVSSETGDEHELINTNILLGQLGIKGFKTGKTPYAGECLVALAESPDGHEILSIVLGSGNRFADTKILVDWIYRAYVW